MAPIVSIKSLEKTYDSGFQALHGISLDIEEGEILAMLGPNGAGKTTLLHTLAGLRPPGAGEVRVGGKPYAAWPGGTVACFRGLLAQQQPDHFAASVLDTVLVGRHPHLGRWDWESAEDLRIARAALAAVGLDGFEARDVLTLSGGERQRVALARALVLDPHALILDEPLSGVDVQLRDDMLALLARVIAERSLTTLLVTHSGREIAALAERVIVLEGGKVTQDAALDVLRAEPATAFVRALAQDMGSTA